MEGYTNFLWTVLLAGTTALGLDPELASRGLGLLAAVAAMAAAVTLARRLAPTAAWAAGLPALWLAVNGYFMVEAIQGLETAFMAALVTGGVACLVRERQQPCRPTSGLLFGLAALTRPEGYLVFAAAMAGALALPSRDRATTRGAALAPLAPFVMVTAPHLLFRRLYYGDWVPHTFHAKTGGGVYQWLRGAEYVAAGWGRMLPWLLLAVVAMALAGRRHGKASSLRPRLIAAAAWLAATAGVAAVGGDFKPTLRFLMWSLPLLAALAAAGTAELWAAAPRRPARALAIGAALLALAWPMLASEPARHFARQRRADLQVLRQAASWLDANLPAGAVIATGPAGAIPYYTGRTTLDMWGLNDPVIGRRLMPSMGSGPAGHEKGDGAYVLARRPNVILFTEARFSPAPLPEERVAQGYLYVSERELLALPEFRQAYRWRSVSINGLTMNFYQRNPEETTQP